MMKRTLFILVTVVALPVHPAANPYFFPFDMLNTPDEPVSDALRGLYFSGGFYYLDDSGEPYHDDIEPQSYSYYFIPLNIGYEFVRGFTTGMQITIFDIEDGDLVPDGYGDVWLKAKYSKRVNGRFSLGGRVAGKLDGVDAFSTYDEKNAEALDLTFFGGAELTKRLSTEFIAGYRFIGKTEASYDDVGNLFHASGGPILSFRDDALTVAVPVSYYGQSTLQAFSDEYGNIFYGETKHRTVSIGPRAAYTFGDQFPSSVTFRAEIVIDDENVDRDYFIGGGYSAVAPF
jgi:hypothetical protein